MSTPAPAPAEKTKAHNGNVTAPVGDWQRLKFVRFVAGGLSFGKGGPNAHESYVTARPDPNLERGYDLFISLSERRFRIEEYREGKHVETHYLHETRAEDYKPW